MLQASSLLELVHQPVVSTQGEVHGLGFVVVRIQVEVLDDVREEVGALAAAPWHLVAQLGKVDVEVVVGRLVVQVDSQLTGWKQVALQDGLLMHSETGRSSSAGYEFTVQHGSDYLGYTSHLK